MRHLLYIILAFQLFFVVAQQEQHYTQFMINPYTINPALGGTEGFTDVKLGYRRQWVNLASAPITYYASAHTSIGREYNAQGYHHKTEHKSWHGLGGYFYGDEIGNISRKAFYGQYSYNLPLSNDIRLSLGAFLGVKQFSYDLSGLKREDLVDASIPFSEVNELVPDMSLGVWFYSDSWFVGASAFQLFRNNVNPVTQDNQETGGLITHSFLTAGSKLFLSEYMHAVPSLTLKNSQFSALSLDLNMKVDYDDKYFAGLSFRSEDAFAVMAGAVINNQIEVSYSYDITISALDKVSNGSHEIILGYRLAHHNNVVCASSFW